MALPTAAIEGDVVEEVLLGAAVLLVEAVEVGAQFLADGVALAELRLVDGGHIGEDVLVVGLVALGGFADVFDDGLLAVVVDLAFADILHHTHDKGDDELEVGFVLNVADVGDGVHDRWSRTVHPVLIQTSTCVTEPGSTCKERGVCGNIRMYNCWLGDLLSNIVLECAKNTSIVYPRRNTICTLERRNHSLRETQGAAEICFH